MASLSVRKLDDTIYEQLRIRAIQHGVSMEEEARQILSQAVSAPQKISAVFRQHFGQKNGFDLNSSHPRTPHNPMDFDELL
ncbi:MAG: FitA-like ribbon-helix-helix domain-containing protein [Gammaproteobacteria bacterium]